MAHSVTETPSQDTERCLILQDVLFPPQLQPRVDELYDSVLISAATPEQLSAARGIIAVLHRPMDENLFARVPNVVVVSNFGAGYDHVDVKAAEAHGIVCGHTPGVRLCISSLGLLRADRK